MTFEELEERADKIGAVVGWGWIEFGEITFWNDGVLEVYPESDVMVIAKDRTPEQMYQIMEALR